MKIKALILASALVLCGNAFAQETNRDANGNIQKGPYETNGFWDNWFVGIGGGVDANLDGVSTGDAKFQVNPVLDVNFGKWIDPCFGARVGYNGWGTVATTGTVLNNNLIHADFLWNISNQFWGYKETRVYNCIPYASAGLITGSMAGSDFAYGIGLLNNFRLSEKLNIFVDIKALDVRAEQVRGIGGHAPQLYATAGLSFNLGKANWTRKATTLGVAASAIAAAEAAKNAAQAAKDAAEAGKKAADAANGKLSDENAALRDALAKASGDNEALLNDLLSQTACVYFEIGKAKLSKKELAHLDYIVNTILSNGKNLKFTLAGNADTKTGSAKRNQKLSQMRADYVYDLLTGQYGLSEDQFEVVYNGGNDIFDTAELNRAVIIEKK